VPGIDIFRQERARARNRLDATRTNALLPQSTASIFPVAAGCHPARAEGKRGDTIFGSKFYDLAQIAPKTI